MVNLHSRIRIEIESALSRGETSETHTLCSTLGQRCSRALTMHGVSRRLDTLTVVITQLE